MFYQISGFVASIVALIFFLIQLLTDVRSKDSKYPVRVKFVNRTRNKLQLVWLNQKGKFKKVAKMKEGQAEVIDSYEGHKFVVDAKKGSEPLINGNQTFIVHATPGSSGEIKAEITHGPSKNHFIIVKNEFFVNYILA